MIALLTTDLNEHDSAHRILGDVSSRGFVLFRGDWVEKAKSWRKKILSCYLLQNQSFTSTRC